MVGPANPAGRPASRLLASRIPQAELVMIEGGSHAMAIEMRGEFYAAVRHFRRAD
jgi:hypothetical protein